MGGTWVTVSMEAMVSQGRSVLYIPLICRPSGCMDNSEGRSPAHIKTVTRTKAPRSTPGANQRRPGGEGKRSRYVHVNQANPPKVQNKVTGADQSRYRSSIASGMGAKRL
ncbi:MAG: hypothetical protein EBS08_00850 [Cytophagia bacterium]|nr:hypothetical protein [Cytophagia bacterium]